MVREGRQHLIHELLCVREFPRDIHRRNSLRKVFVSAGRETVERKDLSIIDNETGEGELVGIEHKSSCNVPSTTKCQITKDGVG
jgi:hypothetical protein